jgi:hypothetical protein
MNRGIYLAIPQPNLEDLKTTAEILAESYDAHNAKVYKDLFENLAITYYEYKNELIQKNIFQQDFHGTRDFYHLIRNAARKVNEKLREKENEQLKEKDNENIIEKEDAIDEQVKKMIGLNSIERNFGGLELDNKTTSLEMIKAIYKQKYEEVPVTREYDVLQKIRENINDNESRYLLLISKSSTSYYLLMQILNEESKKRNYSFHIGSRFKQDISTEEYSLKILNKVQLQMEQDRVLLLSDLESVYPSLYDLFNQNFLVVSEKNYARIAIGGTNNTYSYVNDNFKCIVLVDQSMLNKEDSPFLNRFEKHIISFEYLLKDDLPEISDDIYQIIKNITKNFLPEKFELHYKIKNLLVNCGQNSYEDFGVIFNDEDLDNVNNNKEEKENKEDKEEIQGIIYSKYYEIKTTNNRKANRQELQDYVLEKISLTLPQDIILFMNYSGFKQKYQSIYEKGHRMSEYQLKLLIMGLEKYHDIQNIEGTSIYRGQTLVDMPQCLYGLKRYEIKTIIDLVGYGNTYKEAVEKAGYTFKG